MTVQLLSKKKNPAGRKATHKSVPAKKKLKNTISPPDIYRNGKPVTNLPTLSQRLNDIRATSKPKH